MSKGGREERSEREKGARARENKEKGKRNHSKLICLLKTNPFVREGGREVTLTNQCGYSEEC